MWGTAEAIAKYGEIIGYQEYPDIDNVDNLMAAGEYFLMTQQFESMLFEVTAAERHYLNVSLDVFKAGQMVHFVSNPHFVDMMLPVQSVEVKLDSAEKKVTLGTQKKQTLTKIQRKVQEQQEENTSDIDDAIGAIDDIQTDVGDIQDDIGDLFENQGIVIGDDGNPYTIGVDENGDVYAKEAEKIPVYIMFVTANAFYRVGSTYNGTPNHVVAFYSTDPDAEGEDITDKCEYTLTYWSGGELVEVSAEGFTFENEGEYTLHAKYTVRRRTKTAQFGVSALYVPPGYYLWDEVYVTDAEYENIFGGDSQYQALTAFAGVPNGKYFLYERATYARPGYKLFVFDETPVFVAYFPVGGYRGYNSNLELVITNRTHYEIVNYEPKIIDTSEYWFNSGSTSQLSSEYRIKPQPQ
jgi:hypothetical protein